MLYHPGNPAQILVGLNLATTVKCIIYVFMCLKQDGLPKFWEARKLRAQDWDREYTDTCGGIVYDILV